MILNRVFNLIKKMFRKAPPESAAVVMGNSLVSGDSLLGDYTYIGYNCCVTKTTIGRYCSIANNVSIGQGEHDHTSISTSSLFYEKPYEQLTAGDCRIGNDVWIGVDSIVRRGVQIGDGAVIGANSFVNSDIPPYAIAVGSPAKVLRFRFGPDKIKFIQESRWWTLDKAQAKICIDQLEAKLK